MITSGMTTQQILHEFWKDYEEIICPRTFGWIRGHQKELQKYKSPSGWIMLPQVREVCTPGMNRYRNHIKILIDKKKNIMFTSTTYITLVDSRTGRNSVLLLPTKENKEYLISFDSHFIYRWSDLFLGRTGKFQDLVDEFMRTELKFKAGIMDELEEGPNSYIDLGEKRIGIGRYEKNKFSISTCLSEENVETWRKELNLGDNKNALEIYLEHKKGKEQKEEIKIPELPKTDKEKEIEAAWKEWEEIKRGN